MPTARADNLKFKGCFEISSRIQILHQKNLRQFLGEYHSMALPGKEEIIINYEGENASGMKELPLNEGGP